MPCTRFVYLMTTLHIINIRLNASGRSQDFILVMVYYMFAAEKATKYASLYKIVLLKEMNTKRLDVVWILPRNENSTESTVYV